MEVIMSSPVQECSWMENDNGNGAPKLTKSQRKNRKRALKKKLNANVGLSEKREDAENPKSKPEMQFYTISPSSLQDNSNTGVGTSATVDMKMAMSSPAITGDEKSSSFKGKEHIEVANGEMGSNMTTNFDGEVKVQKKMENTIGETSSGTGATDNTSSKKRKRKKMKNNSPDLGGILSTRESTQEGLSMTKVIGVKSNETVSGEIATPDANMVSKEQDHTEVAYGKTGESETTDFNVNSNKKNRKEQKSKNKLPTLGEILNPQYLQNMEAAKGKTGSGATSKDNPASKNLKRQKLNKNPDLGDILSTRENTQEGLSTTKVLEVKSGGTVLAKTATPDANMVSKGDHSEVANGKMGESETTNLNVNDKNIKQEVIISSLVQECSWKENDDGNGAPKLTKSQKRNRKRALKKKFNANLGSLEKREDTENPKSKPEIEFYTISPSSLQDNPNTGIATSATVDKKMAMSSPAVTGDERSSSSKGKEHTEVANGENGSSVTTNLNVEVKVQKKMETTIGETSSGTSTTYNTASKKRKRKRKKMKNNNPDLGDILSTHQNIQEGLSTTKVLEVKSGEIVSGKTGTSDANMVSTERDHPEVANGKTWESEITDLNVNGKEKVKKKPKSKNKMPTLGEILNPQYLHNLEAAEGGTGSGTTSTDNPASKKQKRQKLNKSPDLDDILGTREGVHEGLSTTEVLEVKSGETVSGKTATSDANTVSKGDHTEVATGEMLENEANKQNVSGKKRKKKKPKSKNKGLTLGENLNPQYLQNLEDAKPETGSGTIATDTPASKKQKRQETNSEISEKRESHDTIITNKGSGTAESGREDFQEIVNGEKCPSAIGDAESTMLKSIVPTQASDGETNSKSSQKRKIQDIIIMNKGSSTAESERDDFQEIVNSEKCLGTIADAESTMLKSVAFPQFATMGKKLVIFDVNGLLADVVSHRPKDIKADKYITKRAIFKRPYLDDFLCFCFERFNVGIWSSRTMKNLRPVVDFLLGDLKKKLLFLWDGSKCTNSGIGTLENKYKRVVVKDLRNIWDKDGPNKSWVKGTFHESNTLLVDDSPYKALLNPKHTGIFPISYSYKIRDDNFLGPNGDLQIYLEGLAAADDVKTYVEQHPFGQVAIDEKSTHWAFYSRILERLNAGGGLNISKRFRR